MTADQYIAWVRSLLKGKRTRAARADALRAIGFLKLETGGYKEVFHHPLFPSHVVKLFLLRHDWYSDASTCGVCPRPLRQFWLPNIYVSRAFVIQPALDVGATSWSLGHDAWMFFRRQFGDTCVKRWDLRQCNVGYHRGKPVVVDYQADRCYRPRHCVPRLKPVRHWCDKP